MGLLRHEVGIHSFELNDVSVWIPHCVKGVEWEQSRMVEASRLDSGLTLSPCKPRSPNWRCSLDANLLSLLRRASRHAAVKVSAMWRLQSPCVCPCPQRGFERSVIRQECVDQE